VTSSPKRWGILYGLGLGPGDPELVTLKAQRILCSVPILLLAVRHAEDPGYAWAIAEPHLVPGQQLVVRLPFPQERGEAELDDQWDENCRRILELMADGRDAAFLTEGDPLLYSTFIQVAARLRVAAPDLPLEIVPGVTSITAAAAAAGQPLVARGGRLAVVPAVYGTDELRRTLEDFDTVVLLKVNRVLGQVRAALDDLGLAERATLVARCGRPEQRVVRGLQNLQSSDLDYFSLIIVRNHARGRAFGGHSDRPSRHSKLPTRHSERSEESGNKDPFLPESSLSLP
jgi:precorrin-2/cobalt-factor-2 C20-methyltransferase